MRAFRARSSAITSIALIWQLLVVILVPVAVCGRQGDESIGSPPVAMAADCPAHHGQHAAPEPACPLHAAPNVEHECDCPVIGCSQNDLGFMALFGSVGILPAPSAVSTPQLASDAPLGVLISTISLAAAPVAPPPRS